MKKFIKNWVIGTLAVLVAGHIVHGIEYQQWADLFIASLLLGILNAVLRPVLMLMALPLVIATLGIFTFFINALLLYFVGFILRPHFTVGSFWAAFWGALIISLISLILNALTGETQTRARFTHRRRPPGSDREDGSGPVIDI